MELNVETIKDLISSIGHSGIDRLHLETEEFKLLLEKTPAAVPTAPQVQISNAVQAAPCDQSQEEAKPAGDIVTSPIVGTFYASASPEKPPFARVGQSVKKGDTLFIVESMKLMNEVTSEFDGKVAEIYAEDGQGVEYGQKIMRIE